MRLTCWSRSSITSVGLDQAQIATAGLVGRLDCLQSHRSAMIPTRSCRARLTGRRALLVMLPAYRGLPLIFLDPQDQIASILALRRHGTACA